MRKIFIAVLAASLVLLNSFSAFASVASPSVASPSVALPMDENVLVDSFDTIPFSSLSISPLSVSYSEVTNTVDYSDTYVELVYYDMSSVVHTVIDYPDSSGHFTFSRPSDYAAPAAIRFVLMSGSIPPSGKYNLDFGVSYDVGPMGLVSAQLCSMKNYSNANDINQVSDVGFTDIGGDITIESSLDINTGLSFVYFNLNYPTTFTLPLSGSFKFEFTRLSSSTDTAVDTAGVGSSDSAADTAQNTEQIANNTQTIADNQAEIMDTIREQVQYITLQLEAFWNQLAGEFTNLFDKMNDQLSQMLNGIEDQTEQITGALDDVETEINQSTTEINNNIDQSTNQITNGYDNSSLNQAANDYHNADQALDSAQSSAWDQGADRVNDFDFGSFEFSVGIMSALVFCGNWLQNVFDGIGNFGIPITLGLTVVFALMIIGYYRYRS